MKLNHALLSLSLALGTSIAAAQPASPGTKPAGAGPGLPLTAAQQQSMLKLQEAADRLRETITAMRGKSDAKDRDRAISETQEALNATQQAMRALPAEIRNAPVGAVSPTQYNEQVEKMMRAADSLRQSIQAMAKLPAGDARNNAIRQANQALLETQAAVMAAYTVGR